MANSFEPNITCPRCHFRHPGNRTCAEAARLAAVAAHERAEQAAKEAARAAEVRFPLPAVPEEVVAAARLVARWGEETFHGGKDWQIMGLGPKGSTPRFEYIPTPREAGDVVGICNYHGHVIVACEYGILEWEHESEHGSWQYLQMNGLAYMVRFP
jgi:hypothetical protein